MIHWLWYGPKRGVYAKPQARCGMAVPQTQLTTSSERRVTCPRCLEIMHAMPEPEPITQTRDNPREPANEHIRNALTILAARRMGATLDEADLKAVEARLRRALAQLERVDIALPNRRRSGIVRRGNPLLGVLGNPRDVVRAPWGKIEYRRPDDPDGEDIIREHEFTDGFEIHWLKDGSVQLSHPRHPLWVEDGA